MDVKRLEDIRDFIINEMDNGLEDGKYYNIPLYIEYVRYNSPFNNVKITIFDYDAFDETIIENVFLNIEIKYYNDILNRFLIITIPIEQDFKVLNRKRKLWMLKD